MSHDEPWTFWVPLSSHKPIYCSAQLWGREGQTWKHTPEEDHRPRKKGCRMMLDGQSSGMFDSKSSSTGQNFKSGLRPWLPGVLRKESAALRPAAGEALIPVQDPKGDLPNFMVARYGWRSNSNKKWPHVSLIRTIVSGRCSKEHQAVANATGATVPTSSRWGKSLPSLRSGADWIRGSSIGGADLQ